MDIEQKKKFAGIVDELCSRESYRDMIYVHNHDVSMPSRDILKKIMNLIRAVLFPGYYMEPDLHPENLSYYTGAKLDEIYNLLHEQILRGHCFNCMLKKEKNCDDCENTAKNSAFSFIEKIPEIRCFLADDVKAAYEGDPAAESYGEVIYCYPSIRAVTDYRVAHTLFHLNVPLIPRIISEMAHSATGIDIHPRAEIGRNFFIDHGTGVVIGSTCHIGDNVKLYQNVTLGARSFPLDENGNPVKGVVRHPLVGDNVIIYSGATVLGRVTIGENAVIGGNVWLTENVAPREKILNEI